MFRDIRKKITLFNTLILIAFLILFIILLCVVVQWSLSTSGESYLKNVAASVESGNLQSQNEGFLSTTVHEQMGYEYIEWDDKGSVVSQQISNSDLISEGYSLLADSDGTDRYETLKIGDRDYRLYTTAFDKDGKTLTLQVFQDTTTENSVISYIISYLLMIGAAGLLLLIPLSWFLAGRSLRPIRENFELQKKFIADASHELRTPITVIQTNVEVLKMKEDEHISDNMEWLSNIDNECDTMGTLISELLTTAQNEKPEKKEERLRFSMTDLCVETVELMRPLAREKDIRLESAVASGITYFGNPGKIRQLLRIFLDNALKYTPAGGLVVLGLSENKRSIVIKFSDNGLGIPEKDQQKIFSRFYRVDDARSRATGGTGLGLNIADSIVRNSGGKIKLDSEPGKGSCFTVLLPKNANQKI